MCQIGSLADAEFKGQARRTLLYALEQSYKQGFNFAFAEATMPASTALSLRLGVSEMQNVGLKFPHCALFLCRRKLR